MPLVPINTPNTIINFLVRIESEIFSYIFFFSYFHSENIIEFNKHLFVFH